MRVGKEKEKVLDQSRGAKKSLKSGKRKVDRLNTRVMGSKTVRWEFEESV
jgi:hypothetical protein